MSEEFENTILEIVYQDDFLVAINKPHGLLVHRSPIAADASEFAIQLLRDQLGRKVYPTHRLDRKTSGVLLFALDESTNRTMQQLFMNQGVSKTYKALVRGFIPENGTIDYALTTDEGKTQDAVTHYERIETFELPIPFGKHATSRYSLVKLDPETGRMHQLRKHLAHIFYPIIGDRPHGCNKQNKFFLEQWQMNKMLLHAEEISFDHPVTKEAVVIRANYSEDFQRILAEFESITLIQQ
jgi:tRNA pseudouridine65 synthase